MRYAKKCLGIVKIDVRDDTSPKLPKPSIHRRIKASVRRCSLVPLYSMYMTVKMTVKIFLVGSLHTEDPTRWTLSTLLVIADMGQGNTVRITILEGSKR